MVVRGPLHSVVDFPGWWLWQMLSRFLIHLPFGFEVNGAILRAMVGFAAVIHAIWRFQCVWASTVPPAMV
jgi:hypothetical protein